MQSVRLRLTAHCNCLCDLATFMGGCGGLTSVRGLIAIVGRVLELGRPFPTRFGHRE